MDTSHLEINKELVLSTAHIQYFTSIALAEGHATDNDDGVRYGWRIWAKANVDPIHKELVLLLALTRENDCKWLILDQDGDTCKNLPTFEW